MKIDKLDNAEYKRLIETTMGKKIRLLSVEGCPVAAGLEGVVKIVSETGKLRGTWGNFPLDCSLDKWEVID